jgi:glycosidase
MAAHFETVDWAKAAVVYEVNIRQYTQEGTFKAFEFHLPRLKRMGVDILWLMPVTPISKEERQGTLGSFYACSSYDEINPEFGTIDDLRQLIKSAHALNMKVIIDWVANHTGCDHEWTIEHPDWYIKDDAGNFTERNGWKDVIDLNYDMLPMRAAMIEAMQFWVRDCDIDGFRCDMAHLVTLDFWKSARQQCDMLKPLFWLAECEVTAYLDVFDANYAWAWMHVTEQYVKNESSIGDIYNILHSYSQSTVGAKKLFFTSNHDENSWNGTEYEKFGDLAKAMAVFSFTWDGMPLIYSGQEIPSNKRLKFFDKDQIDWIAKPTLEDFYTSLSTLHHSDVISNGETFILPTDSEGVMAFLRRSGDNVVLVILNMSVRDRNIVKVQHDWLKGSFTNIFSGLTFNFEQEEQFEMQAYEYLVYSKTV